MESKVIADKSLGDITAEDTRVRFVGKVEKIDDIGMFDVSEGDKKVTCLPPVSVKPNIGKGDFVLVTGRVALGDSKEDFEVRTDSVRKISGEERDNYNKYLKIRSELLNNGS